MKFDLLHQFTGLDGQPATTQVAEGYDKTGMPTNVITVPTTIGHVLKTSLNSPGEEKELSKLIQRGTWAMEIAKGNCPEFTTDDLPYLKAAIHQSGLYSPIIMWQFHEYVEQLVKSPN